mgnify:CR=1 FL=1
MTVSELVRSGFRGQGLSLTHSQSLTHSHSLTVTHSQSLSHWSLVLTHSQSLRRRSPFVVRRSSFVVCRSSFVVRCSLFVVRCSSSSSLLLFCHTLQLLHCCCCLRLRLRRVVVFGLGLRDFECCLRDVSHCRPIVTVTDPPTQLR